MGYKNVPKDKIDFLTDGNAEDKQVFESIIRGEKQSESTATNLLLKFFNK